MLIVLIKRRCSRRVIKRPAIIDRHRAFGFGMMDPTDEVQHRSGVLS